MTTIKSFTDINQSKKLAEILPLKSADMHWTKDFDGSWFVDLSEYTSVKIPKYVGNIEEYLLPCWSLAALLNVLPYGYSSILTKSFNGKDYYCKIDGKPLETKADNLVDACVEMIIKIHELNLL